MLAHHLASVLSSHNQKSEGIQTLTEQITLLREGNTLSNCRAEPKEVANLIKGSAKACCGLDVSRIHAWDNNAV